MVNDVIRDYPMLPDIISTVNGLNLFLNIPKIREVYKDKHLKMFPRNKVKILVQQIEICWGCKFEAIDLLVDRLPLLLDN